jgi:hypothetical protein
MSNVHETPPNSKEALRSEHLNNGVSPIMFCVGSTKQFGDIIALKKDSFDNNPEDLDDKNHLNYHDIDYDGDPWDLNMSKFKNAGEQTYVISIVDNLDKYSKRFVNCTGIVATGLDKKINQNISLLSHQDPEYFLSSNSREQARFVRDLEERLSELKRRSEKGTIDAGIIGGKYIKYIPEFQKQYLESIKFLSKIIKNILGFEPVILTGSKKGAGDDTVFYQNNQRRLYILRPDIGDGSTETYSPSDIKKQKEKWR